MIKPTNGRVVLFTPGTHDPEFAPFKNSHGAQPLAAHVCHVWHDRMVNLLVIDPNGHTHSRTSVTLLQEDDPPHPLRHYCEWMPYQKGQAAKTEALEQKLGGAA